MYEGIRSTVKWEGVMSEEFEEGQGIRQGGLSSANLFKNRSTPMLNRTSSHPDCFSIGHIKCGAIMVADDLVLASRCNRGLQNLINEAEADAKRERYIFSETKTKCQVVNHKHCHKSSVIPNLNGKPLDYSEEETHLGINRRADQSYTSTINSRIQSGRKAIYSIAGAGLYGLRGVSPDAALKLLQAYVTPCMLYGLEALCISTQDILPLEKYYRTLLKSIQHLPNATANAACYLLLGVLPIEGQIHVKMLTLFGSILRRDGSVEREIAVRQLTVKDDSSSSWFIHIKKLLQKYDLPSIDSLVCIPTKKEAWKKTVKKAVEEKWYEQLCEEAKTKSTLSYLNTEECGIGHLHPAWDSARTDPHTSFCASIRVKILVQRYPIATSHTAGRSRSLTCKLCNEDDESMIHFLLQCTALASARSEHLASIMSTIRKYHVSVDPETMVKHIIDPTHIIDITDEDLMWVEECVRKLCFKLHVTRSVLLASESDDDHGKSNALAVPKIYICQNNILTPYNT